MPARKHRPCESVCVCGGAGHSVLFMPEQAGEGCQHQLPAPHNDANLAPATLFCFCHILGGFSHPPPPPQVLRLLCVIYLLILSSGSRGPELCWGECTSRLSPTTNSPSNTQLTQTPGHPISDFLRFKK